MKLTVPRRLMRMGVLSILLFGLLPATAARAQTTLNAEIVSWQIIGLDSNDPVSGTPELFMVQAQITNTGAEPATSAEATISLISPSCGPSDCISLASSPTFALSTIPVGETVDAFWTVRVAKSALALGTTTTVQVSASASNAPAVIASQASRNPAPCGQVATGPGVLYVERLISQARNDVLSYSVDPAIQRPDGSWEVVRGSTFTVTVIASTATAYNEISVPAVTDPSGTITPSSVAFAYELGTSSDDDIYTLNAGGMVTANYTYTATNVGSLTLSQLIYDCSGNSFHYNSDYLDDSITIHVVDAPSQPTLTLSKSVSPSGAVSPGDRLTFTINYSNIGLAPATGVVITDVVSDSLTDVVPGPGGAYDPSTRTITWNVGTVGGQTSGAVTFTAVVGDFAGGSTIRNSATADSDQTPPTSSGEITISVRQTTPATGAPSALLAVLGWAAIGFGNVLNDRRLGSAALRNTSE